MSAPENLKNIIEAALLAAGGPLSLDSMQTLFEESEMPDKKALREALTQLSGDYQGRGIEISEVASGWRIQVVAEVSPWISRLWSERPARYSRALMETLALIAYRQPITRGEIEDIRGVSVSSNIVKTLLEREWIRVVGHRDVPGKPSLYGTTREFLDYFDLKTLDDLPTLAEIRDLDEINRELDLNDTDKAEQAQAAEEPAMPEDEPEAPEPIFAGDVVIPEDDELPPEDTGAAGAGEAVTILAADVDGETDEIEEAVDAAKELGSADEHRAVTFTAEPGETQDDVEPLAAGGAVADDESGEVDETAIVQGAEPEETADENGPESLIAADDDEPQGRQGGSASPTAEGGASSGGMQSAAAGAAPLQPAAQVQAGDAADASVAAASAQSPAQPVPDAGEAEPLQDEAAQEDAAKKPQAATDSANG